MIDLDDLRQKVQQAYWPTQLEILALIDRCEEAEASVARVRAIHAPEVIDGLLTGDCATEECGHENGCLTTGTVTVCAECYRVAEEADSYYGEEGFGAVEYPCPTISALDGEDA